MKLSILLFLAALNLQLAACSEKPTTAKSAGSADLKESGPRGEKEEADADGKPELEAAPEAEEIGEDCVGFLRATRSVPGNGEAGDCLNCPGGSTTSPEVLKFETFDIDKISSSEAGCEVSVRIQGVFNPSNGGKIVGGLTGWISPEQKASYSQGKTPPGRQTYKVRIIYRRPEGYWKAIEFAKGNGS